LSDSEASLKVAWSMTIVAVEKQVEGQIIRLMLMQ
jgi:hypothetical protein